MRAESENSYRKIRLKVGFIGLVLERQAPTNVLLNAQVKGTGRSLFVNNSA